jgi:hypothetical protein
MSVRRDHHPWQLALVACMPPWGPSIASNHKRAQLCTCLRNPVAIRTPRKPITLFGLKVKRSFIVGLCCAPSHRLRRAGQDRPTPSIPSPSWRILCKCKWSSAAIMIYNVVSDSKATILSFQTCFHISQLHASTLSCVMMQDCHKREYDVTSDTPDVFKRSKVTGLVNSTASPLHMGATAPSRASVVKTLSTKSLKLLEEAVAPLLEAGCTLGLSLSLALTQGLQQAVHAACDAVGVRVS